MKCENCGCDYEKDININCPSCGCKNIGEFYFEPAYAARKVVDIFGMDIISDYKRFCAAFSDIAPKLSKENKVFYVALSEKIGSFYLDSYEKVKSGEIKIEDINNKAYSLISEYLNSEKANMVIQSISFALGFDVSVNAEKNKGKAENAASSGFVIEDLFRKANNGDVDAQYNLAERFFFGNGMNKNCEEAVKWYEKAAIQGSCNAQKRLADCYRTGHGIGVNYSKAVDWYYQAAEQGDYESQKALVTYLKSGGEGLQKNKERAAALSIRYGITLSAHDEFENLIKNAENDDANSQYELANNYYIGKNSEKNLSKAFSWYKRAAELGHSEAQFNLAHCFAVGEGTGKDDKKAFYWYTKSAETGDTDAINNLAACYFHGNGIERDYFKAAELYLKAAEHGNARAQYNYGECCYNGYGVRQDYKAATEWYKKSAKQLNADAQYSLGWCYSMGEGVERDYNTAKYYFEQSAVQRNVYAQISLAYCYLNGHGTEKNYVKAVEWFNKSAIRGSTEAAKMLVKCWKTGGFYLSRDDERAHRAADKFGINFEDV